MAILDGSHEYAVVHGEFAKAIEHGANCIVVHDTESRDGPHRLADEMRERLKDQWDAIQVGFDAGLAVFVKQSVT